MSGEDGKEVTVGRSEHNTALNRFKNITPCEFKDNYVRV